MGKFRFLWEYKGKIPYLILYYGFCRWLPASFSPVLGKVSKKMRYFCCKHIFAYCGKNVNVERGVLFGSGKNVRIGDNSGIGINCVVPSDIEIGDNVLMGPKCFILYRNHRFERKDRTIKEQGYTERYHTKIGNDVWIGREVLFTPGRTVQDGTVIAARTCLCKDFPAYSVVGGNPARIIKERV